MSADEQINKNEKSIKRLNLALSMKEIGLQKVF